MLVGAAVHIVDFSIDGYALSTLADTWAVASSSERPDLEFGARLALVIIGGPSTVALIILWGSTLILYGLAVKMEGYSRWLDGGSLGWRDICLGDDTVPQAEHLSGGSVLRRGHMGLANMDPGSRRRDVASRGCPRADR